MDKIIKSVVDVIKDDISKKIDEQDNNFKNLKVENSIPSTISNKIKIDPPKSSGVGFMSLNVCK